LVLWLVLLAAMLLALWILNANAIRVIDNIEYLKSGRYQAAMALYAEAGKRARNALTRASDLNTSSDQVVLLPANDPDYVAAMTLYGRATALDPRDSVSKERRWHFENMAALCGAVGAEAAQTRFLAWASLCEGDPDSIGVARTYANALAVRDPRDVDAWRILVETDLRSTGKTPAEDSIRRFLEAGGSSGEAAEFRARLAEAAQDIEEAKKQYRIVLEANPRNIAARKKLAALLGSTQEASKVLQDGLAQGGARDGNYLHRYGILLLSLENNADAIKMLEDAAELERNSGDVRWDLARAYHRIGQKAKSNAMMQEAIRIKPELQKTALDKERP
jgi:tetratricopeptide (TPR) repeat protein